MCTDARSGRTRSPHHAGLVSPEKRMTTETRPRIAAKVVYRHPCDCQSASRALHEGEHAEHRFDVDGESFPWYIHEDGPSFTRLKDDLWRIDVRMYGHLQDGLFHDSNGGVVIDAQPNLIISGREFPWAISGDGFTYHRSHKELASVRLGFFAEHVDTDGQFNDLRRANRAVYINGDLIRDGLEDCGNCGSTVADLFTHFKDTHPEHVHTQSD